MSHVSHVSSAEGGQGGVLTIDFGGTRIRAAWWSPDLRLVARHELRTHVDDGVERVVARLIEAGKAVCPAGAAPAVIGVAAPGPLNPLTGVIYHADTLPGWEDVPLGQRLSDAFGGCSTFLQNDANLAALAEYQRGAGRKHGTFADPLIYLTVSTGIGGGVVIGGRLFVGWSGLAAEPGHMLIGTADGTPQKLEQLASGTALGQRARQRLLSWPGETILREVPSIDGQAVGTAAAQGDALALAVVNDAAGWLGLGLVNLIHLFSPEMIILGGSVTQLGDLLLVPVRRMVEAHLLDPLFLPHDGIRLASLGDDVCLLGAALYANQQIADQR